MGFTIVATRGTARTCEANGLPVATINKVLEGRPHVVDAIKNGEVHLVFNTTEGAQALATPPIRRTALTESAVLHDHRGRAAVDRSDQGFACGHP